MTVQSLPRALAGSAPHAPLPLRIEIVPTEGILPKVATTVPQGSTIAVTCLPHHGIERTAEASTRLAALGYRVVPHLAARSIGERSQLARALRGFQTAGITEVFAVGGDAAQAAGPYANSLELMEDIAELAGGQFAIGVAGYPEGHPDHSGIDLLDALLAKQHLAANIVTQMCFSASAISAYVALLRSEGIHLPVWAGVPGRVPRARLLELAVRIGVGPSLKFISRKGPLARRLLTGGSYSSEQLIGELSAARAGLAGVHLFTFNNLDLPKFDLAERGL
ncbi:methylenetetrahydrofolate reductase [Sinomonas sp. ASV486]|uniref:methylenetetrahydrofolate reductase n=1 Tax=Sinomonas sp. ASV486 TaxID=3051170 RepID=UPI0027DDD881|nr:methylenetetrahydrofolate reductase [Sinomonas sp. ASV486]MDQ4489988.1 methylenetetrahydrofolate reductase [Sinomonas sp. ASV486]